jgi:rhodanese-related sulfurtransferase
VTLAEERESTAAGLFGDSEGDVPRITTEELSRLMESPEPPVVLDVRSRSSFERDRAQIPGSVRVLPDQVVEWASGQPRDWLIVAYCT